MHPCKVVDIVRETGGTLLWGLADQTTGSISTDSRTIQPGQVFWAIQGPNFDGNAFIREAFERKAAGVIVSTDPENLDHPEGTFAIQVPDTQRALGDFASYHRHRINPCVVAVSGSSGKTTTKDMLTAILGAEGKLLATEGNKNNLIGLPQTLLRLEEGHEIAVVELGMNRPGELARLTEIARPDVGLITNIFEAHIGQFGSLKNLIAGEAEIIDAMPRESLLVMNADCAQSAKALESARRPLQLMTFGVNTPADVMAEEILKIQPFGYRMRIRARGNEAWVELHLFGRFQVYNSLAAIGVSLALGVPLADAAERLNNFRPASMRTEVEEFKGMRLLKDCYNAAPTATMEAIASLRDYRPEVKGRMVALLGDMLELGDFEEMYHRAVGQRVVDVALDLVVTVGRRARTIHEVVCKAGLPCRHCDTPAEAGMYLAETLRPNDTLLVKGSRLMRLEEAISTLKQRLNAA